MEDEPQGPALTDYARGLLRRVWIPILAVMIGAPLAAGIAYILPPVFVSTARILVESQQIPSDLARSTVTASAAERLEIIQQRLLTRQNLIDVIEELDVYAEIPEMSLAGKIDRLRESVTFENIQSGASGRRGPVQLSAFTISFQDSRPVRAAQVANEFVTLALEQNIRARAEQATETLDFFEREVERLSAELLVTEGELIEFKRENAESLPDGIEARRVELQDISQRLFDNSQRSLTLTEQRLALELQLSQGTYAVTAEAALTPEARQLRALRNTLTQRRAVLSGTHPEIRALEAQIAALEAEVRLTAADPVADLPDTAAIGRAELERQIGLIDRQLALIETQTEESERRREELVAAFGSAPQVEMALTALERRHLDLQSQFAVASAKRADAATGEKLEANRQAERFEVIEQAQVPERPEAPNRMLIAAGGTIVSLGLGLGLAVLFELMNRALRSAHDLERRCRLRPVVVVPYIQTRSEIRRRRLRIAAVAALVFIGVPLLLYAVDLYFLPLSVLVERLYDRSGLDAVIEMIDQRF